MGYLNKKDYINSISELYRIPVTGHFSMSRGYFLQVQINTVKAKS